MRPIPRDERPVLDRLVLDVSVDITTLEIGARLHPGEVRVLAEHGTEIVGDDDAALGEQTSCEDLLGVGLVEILPVVEEDEVEDTVERIETLVRRAGQEFDPLLETRERRHRPGDLARLGAHVDRHDATRVGKAAGHQDRRITHEAPELEHPRARSDLAQLLLEQDALLGPDVHEETILAGEAIESGQYRRRIARPGDAARELEGRLAPVGLPSNRRPDVPAELLKRKRQRLHPRLPHTAHDPVLPGCASQ